MREWNTNMPSENEFKELLKNVCSSHKQIAYGVSNEMNKKIYLWHPNCGEPNVECIVKFDPMNNDDWEERKDCDEESTCLERVESFLWNTLMDAHQGEVESIMLYPTYSRMHTHSVQEEVAHVCIRTVRLFLEKLCGKKSALNAIVFAIHHQINDSVEIVEQLLPLYFPRSNVEAISASFIFRRVLAKPEPQTIHEHSHLFARIESDTSNLDTSCDLDDNIPNTNTNVCFPCRQFREIPKALQFTVCQPMVVNGAFGPEYVSYTIKVTITDQSTTSSSWSVKRRYSQFRALRRILDSRVEYGEFPPKVLNAWNREIIYKREILLDRWLKSVYAAGPREARLVLQFLMDEY